MALFRDMSAASFVDIAILAVLLPVWLLVGLADWYCHRRAKVEATAGPAESLMHLALSFEAAVAITPALIFSVNALVLLIAIVAFFVHEITTGIDVRYAFPRRAFTTLEQRVHDYLTAIPFAALCLLLASHAGQALALIGRGDEHADFSLAFKRPHLPWAYLVTWFAATAVVNVGPFTEELLRGLKARSAKERARPL